MASKQYYAEEETYWRYYDTPDGQDMVKKAAVCAKYGAVSAFIFSTLDVLMFSHPIGILNIVKRYLYLTVPAAGMGATFAAVANTAQNVRQEDDMLNYLAGGVAAAPWYAVWHRSKLAVFVVAVGFGVAGMAKKTGVDNGWVFFPEFAHGTANARLGRDWTIGAELMPRGFTVGEAGACIPAAKPPCTPVNPCAGKFAAEDDPCAAKQPVRPCGKKKPDPTEEKKPCKPKAAPVEAEKPPCIPKPVKKPSVCASD